MGRKPGKSPSHLIRIGTKYYYRRVISQALSARMGMREIKVTLKTSSLEEARRRSNIIELHVLSILAHVGSDNRVKDITPEQMRRMVKQWLKQKIEEMEDLMSLDNMDPVFLMNHPGKINPQSVEERKASLLAECDLEKKILIGKSRGKTSIETTAKVVLSEAGIEASPDSLVYKRLCRELRKGFLTFVDKEISHIEGSFDDYSGISLTEEEYVKSAAVSASAKNPKQEDKERLSDLLKKYLDSKKSENLKAKTMMEISSKAKLFVDILGNPYPDEVSLEKLTFYKNSLRKVPSNWQKKKKYKNKNLKEILKMDIPSKDILDTTTMNNHLVKAKSFVIWLETYGYITGKNLPKILQKIREPHRPFEERGAFSVGELKHIFSHVDYTKFRYAWEFWLPLIGLYTGMRINEICRLRLDDIRSEEGVFFFDITVTEGDEPKTQAGVRRIPIHDELVRIGLLDYVKRLRRRRGALHLFPDRNYLEGSPSHYPTQKVNKWLKKIGVAKSGVSLGRKTFHSFRHTFETRCQELMLDQRLVDQIMGHSVGNSMSGRYGKPAGILQLKEEVIDKYHFEGLDLSGLCKSKHSI